MADTSNLTNFLGDVADAIRAKKGTEDPIPAANFDTEIASIETGSDTSDATATVDDIISPKTAYINGGKVTGTIIPSYQYQDVKINVLTGLVLNSTILDINDEYKLAVCGSKGSTSSVTVRTITSDNNLGDIVLTITNSDYGGGNFRAAAISKQLNANGNLNVWTACGDYNGIVKVFEINPTEYTLENTTSYSYNGWIYSSAAFRICMAANPTNPNLVAFAHQPGAGFSEGNIAVSIMEYNDTSKVITRKYFPSYSVHNWLDGSPFETEWDSTGRYLVGCFGKVASNHGFIFDTSSNSKIISMYNTGDICMVNDQYWLQNGVLKTYANTTVYTFSELADNSYQWYNDNFIFKVINNTLTIYYIDFTSLALTEMNSVKLTSGVSSAEGIRRPLSNEFLYFMDSGNNGYKFVPVLGEQELISLERNGYLYTYLDSSVTIPPEYVLEGNEFYNSSGLRVGTMPNNGELVYSQSEQSQIIPLGYTSGGAIPAYPQTSEDYLSCILLSNEILTGNTITNLAYIESSGTQYIDTEIVPTNNTVVEMSIKKVGNAVDWERFFGINGAIELLRRYTDPNIKLRVNGTEIGNISFPSTSFTKIKFGQGQVVVNDSDTTSYTNTFTTSSTAYLFRANGEAIYGLMQLQYCKIWENGALIRDFIPVKDFNEVICLLDKLSGKFYYNKGTGNFIGGVE